MMKIGIVGAGAITKRGHMPQWLRLDDVEIAALVDTNYEAVKQVAEEFHISRFTTDYQEILADKDIDIIDICTPTPSHHKLVLAALAADKHVLVEKPLAFSLSEALEIYDQVVAKKKQLCVLQNYRYIEAVTRAKQSLDQGRLGKLATIHGRSFNHLPVGWTRAKWLYHQAAVLFDFTPHLIDMILYLVKDKVKSVRALGQEFTPHAKFLSAAQIIIEFKNGTVAMIDTSWTNNAPRFELELFGNGGSFYFQPMRNYYWEGHGVTMPLDELRILASKFGQIIKGLIAGNLSTKQLVAYKHLFESFIESVKTGARPLINIDDGLNANLVLEAAKLSIASDSVIFTKDLLQQLNASEQARNLLL